MGPINFPSCTELIIFAVVVVSIVFGVGFFSGLLFNWILNNI